MTTNNRFADRNRDAQDGIERHVLDEMTYIDGAGFVLKTNGTGGTVDQEVVFMNIGGVGLHVPKGTDVEVLTFAGGSDTHLKYGIILTPPGKERKWKPGFSGTQKWNDPERALQFGDKRAHLIDKNLALGTKGNFEITDDGDTTYIRGKKIVFEVPPIIGTPAFEEE